MSEPNATELPVEAEPADVQEQRIVVEGDEENERPVTPPSGSGTVNQSGEG